MWGCDPYRRFEDIGLDGVRKLADEKGKPEEAQQIKTGKIGLSPLKHSSYFRECHRGENSLECAPKCSLDAVEMG